MPWTFFVTAVSLAGNSRVDQERILMMLAYGIVPSVAILALPFFVVLAALLLTDAARVIHRMEDVLVFEVRDDDTDGWYAPWAGAVRPRHAWETEQLSPTA